MRISWKKKPIPKDSILYGFIYITFLKWHNFRDEEHINGRLGLRTGKGGGRESGDMVLMALNTHTHKVKMENLNVNEFGQN